MIARLLIIFALLTTLAHAEVYEPKLGSPERKTIMDALRGPVSRHIGKPVIFTGHVKVSGAWATFAGGAAPTDGKPPKGDIGFDLELDLFALLHQENGQWQVLHFGFAGDISAYEDARKKFPQAPRDLLPPLKY